MKVIGYVRVSSEGQLDGFGLDSQEQAVRSWSKDAGHRIIRTVSDVGVSGATDALDRPGLTEVLTALHEGEASGLVVARLDRLARALTVQEATLAIVWRAGAEVFAADHGRILADDPDDPMRTALRQVVGVFAELDRRMVVKRLRDGRAAKAATGRKAVGAYPYGSEGRGRGRSRDSTTSPSEGPVAERIQRYRDEGLSYRAIAARLDDEGLRPRRAATWSPMSVRAVVMRARQRPSPGARASAPL